MRKFRVTIELTADDATNATNVMHAMEDAMHALGVDMNDARVRRTDTDTVAPDDCEECEAIAMGAIVVDDPGCAGCDACVPAHCVCGEQLPSPPSFH